MSKTFIKMNNYRKTVKSRIIRRWNGKITQECQLVLRELQLMSLPIIMMGAFEISQSFTNSSLKINRVKVEKYSDNIRMANICEYLPESA